MGSNTGRRYNLRKVQVKRRVSSVGDERIRRAGDTVNAIEDRQNGTIKYEGYSQERQPKDMHLE